MANITGVDPPPLRDQDYVDKINESLNAIDAHDHTSGKGVQVPTNGIVDGAVTTAKLASSSVTNAKIADGTIDVTTKLTGVLPLANGGTAKALTAVAGGILYSDADSVEILAAGSSGQVLTSNGTSAPSWTSPLTNPMDGQGQLIYGGVSGAATKLAAGSADQYLKSNGASAPSWATFTKPTIQRFTSGFGTYTTPAGVTYIRVRMVGGGAGGTGSGTANNSSAGGDGGATTFGTSLLTASGGLGAGYGGAPGNPGSPTVNSPAIDVASSPGGRGGGFSQHGSTGILLAGGVGGSSFFGGAGSSSAGAAGSAAQANTGAGGGGGGTQSSASTFNSGSGGSAGAYVDAIIWAPDATYAYSVGTGGGGGSAGTGGNAGGAGSAGVIVVEEYYQ